MDPFAQLTDLITKFGFQTFVCIWFMWRDYKSLTSLQELLTGVKDEIGKLNMLLETVLRVKNP
jgi:hypothetical protein